MATVTETLEQQALRLTGMTQEEYDKVMKKDGVRWNHDSTQDGWFLAHEALRLDMQDAHEAFNAVVGRLEKGQNVDDWQISNIQRWWASWVNIVHHHHDNEEKIAFPFMSKTVALPDKMSADHPKLMTALEGLTAIIEGLKPGASLEDNKPVFTKLRDDFDAMRDEMCEHLREEDVVGLPMLRKHFTYKEFQPTEKKIIANLTPMDVGWFLRPKSDADKRAWMTQVAGIPGFVQVLIMMPGAKKYYNKIAILMLEVKAGEHLKPMPTNCFGM